MSDLPSTYPGLTEWLMSGERGLSSECMARHLTGRPARSRSTGEADYPLDPSDFRRCLQLLNATLGMRENLPLMATASPTWARLVDRWADIEALFLEEQAENTGRAPRTYALMSEVIDPT